MSDVKKELQELLGNEFKVRSFASDFTWDKITITKGDKHVSMTVRSLTPIPHPKHTHVEV